MDLSTELVLSHPQGFGLVTATPAQRAICRAIDGLPIPDELWAHEDPRYAEFGPTRVADIFGGVRPHVGTPPRLIVLLSGVRCGKSMLTAAVAAKAAMASADVSQLHNAEKARVSVVSTTTDVAQTTFNHLLGGFQFSQILKAQLTGRPRKGSFDVRHVSGRATEIKVVAGARSGNTLVSRWQAGVIIDEAPRQASGSDGFVVNLESQIDSLSGRMLPGAQIFLPGSPVGPTGYVYSLYQQHFGSPTDDVLVIKAPAYLLNPVAWSVNACRKFAAGKLDNMRSEMLGEWRGQDDALFSSEAIQDAMRAEGQEEEPPYHGHRYYAAIDPATRANAWTFTIGTVGRDGYVTVALARQWQGTKEKPLSPSEIFKEMKPDLDRYNVREVASDQYHFDANKELARAAGIKLKLVTSTQAVKTEMFEDLRQKFLQAEISIPPDQDIRSDLLMVRRRITPRGVPTVVLVVGTNRRHCDYAACLALLNHQLSYAPRTLGYDATYNRYLPPMRSWA